MSDDKQAEIREALTYIAENIEYATLQKPWRYLKGGRIERNFNFRVITERKETS